MSQMMRSDITKMFQAQETLLRESQMLMTTEEEALISQPAESVKNDPVEVAVEMRPEDMFLNDTSKSHRRQAASNLHTGNTMTINSLD